ncbi:HAD family phosphatase [Ferrimonas sp. SCSIO 43195]|uniref:HAD family hydrolase n=1 Tax=Ferrimonas sp. SCSIO 43195 TaxID=2822844 RepID=UPI002075A176|nr:HAD family hydrolase [Ferrimonas sp. SCSIO 43195]
MTLRLRSHLLRPMGATLSLGLCLATAQASTDPLPSWHNGSSKAAIIAYVDTVTTDTNPAFIPEADRIAVFDNDGTLWSEQPLYNQLAFAIDRIHQMAPEHPQWKQTQPFKAVLENDMATALKGGERALLDLVMATHAGISTAEFAALVQQWIDTATHPQTGRKYTQMVYQPMLELLDYLQAHGFTNYIVSGGGIDFMRPWSEAVYGLPPQQVIGSSLAVRYEVIDGVPTLMRDAEIHFIDDKATKPVAIHYHIGKRPVFAFGNSDGDRQMLQWTKASPYLSFAGLVHHTDDKREWAYDRHSTIGKLDKAMDQAKSDGWTLVDMKQEWRQIFPDID